MMVGLRRVAAVVAIAVASLGSAGVMSFVTATPTAALSTCTDSWQGPTNTTTNWNDQSAYWTDGFPTSGSVVCINLPGTYTVELTGNASINTLELGGASGSQTLAVEGSTTNIDLSIAQASTVSSSGNLALISSSGGGASDLSGPGGVTIDSGGALSTSLLPGTSVPVYIETPLTNQAGGTVTIGAPDSRIDNDTATANSGTFSVSGSGNLTVDGGGAFVDSAGSLTLTGTMTDSGNTFTQSGGTESGNPVDLNEVTLVDSSGTGSFDFYFGPNTLTGTIPSGQTVTVDGRTTNVTLTVTGVTDDGTLVLAPSSAGGWANIVGSGSGLTVAPDAVLSTAGAPGSPPAYIEVPVTNETGGTVTIGAPDTRQDNPTLTSNSGTVSVTSEGNFSVGGGGSFTNINTLTVLGTMSETGGTFSQGGGSESGNPIVLSSATLEDSTGSGSFDVISNSTVTGTIPTGQVITVDGRNANVALTVTGVTDEGTIALVSNSTGGYADVAGSGSGLTVASGGVLSTSLIGSGVPAYIETPLTNSAGGTVTIGAPNTRQDSGTTTSNAGTLQVVNGGQLTLSGGSTLSNTGTLGVTVNGTAGGISGPGITLGGSTLAVDTQGSPTLSSTFTPIGGPVAGTFATLSFGPDAYAVTYPSGAVELTTEAPFTLSPTAFAPKENVATGTIQVASIGNANDDSGVYSATVNYGDGSGNQVATVNTTGATGTVDGPSHTYTAAGNYTVTTTVANTNGTTLTVVESVTVTGPTISGFSKVSIKVGRKLTTKISGTGFDSTASVTVSNPQITVVSVTPGKVTKKHPNPMITLKLAASKTAATGPFNVTITQDTGVVTANNAITVVP